MGNSLNTTTNEDDNDQKEPEEITTLQTNKDEEFLFENEEFTFIDETYNDPPKEFPQQNLPIFTTDIVSIICLNLEVKDVVSFLTTCSSFIHFHKSCDLAFWYPLLQRDYPYIQMGEDKREIFIKEKNKDVDKKKFDLRIRRESLLEIYGSYLNVYKEVHKLAKKNHSITTVKPYYSMLINHTTKIQNIFTSFDMLCGLSSWEDGPLKIATGENCQFFCWFIDFGTHDNEIYILSQLVQWKWGSTRQLLGLNGVAVASGNNNRWSYWITYQGEYQKKKSLIARINLPLNSTIHFNIPNIWMKIRYFVSVKTSFKNPGPYPNVELDDGRRAEPAYEFFFYVIDKTPQQ